MSPLHRRPLALLAGGDGSGCGSARALAAEALGRAPVRAGTCGSLSPDDVTAGRVRLLLEAVAGDRYPAVRHLAARGLGRLLDGVSPAAAAAARRYEATGPAETRDREVAALARACAALPGTGVGLERSRLAALRAQAARRHRYRRMTARNPGLSVCRR